ncbi:hypothetical protein AB0L64_05035 [Kribbella sp. NPDC051936]|uniref:hypothetical protein n=1 Tax=Kribbella sp. NPDC051936 TaxID=3154946 RepID=UPI0034378FEB
MTSEPGSAAVSGQDSVVLASFGSYRRAEHMVASLGGGFRRKTRKGDARVAVVRGNADGSLVVTDSRVLEAGDFTAGLMRISLAWVIGFLGLFSMFTGGRRGVRDARERKGRVGSEDHRAHEILADAGPHAAVVLVRCKDQKTRQSVASAAADNAKASWDGTLAEFLAALDPGPAHDWVREAVGEPSHPKS